MAHAMAHTVFSLTLGGLLVVWMLVSAYLAARATKEDQADTQDQAEESQETAS